MTVLTVSGEKKSATQSHDKGLRIVERRYGAFSRSVRLPAGMKAEAIKAGLDQGVLTVTVPLDGPQGPGSGQERVRRKAWT